MSALDRNPSHFLCAALFTPLAPADAILGVSLFSDVAPEQFGKFNRAFITLFRIAAGDTWIDSLAMLGPSGDLEWKPSLFICSFIVISVWVVLQVSMDVLLPCSMPLHLLRPARASLGVLVSNSLAGQRGRPARQFRDSLDAHGERRQEEGGQGEEGVKPVPEPARAPHRQAGQRVHRHRQPLRQARVPVSREANKQQSLTSFEPLGGGIGSLSFHWVCFPGLSVRGNGWGVSSAMLVVLG